MRGVSLTVRQVSKSYTGGQVYAIRDVSLSVPPGAFLTILGPSGSGKTTLLKLVAGLETPETGEVRIGDQDVTLRPPYEREIGMVFQNYALFPNMTVFDNIAFPLQMRRVPQAAITERVTEMLELVKMRGMHQRYPHELSGGQQQRIAVARALAFSPALMLLDEPLAALDRKLRQHMQVELKQIQRQTGVTTIAVTHDQDEALTMSTHICVMNDGRIEQVGTPREVYDRPASSFVAGFVGEANLFPGRVTACGNGECSVETAWGVLIGRAPPSSPATNTAVTVMIRPEVLHLGSAAGGSVNHLKGHCTDVIYEGASLRLTVALEDETAIEAVLHGPKHDISIGDPIDLSCSPDDLVVLSH